MKVKIGSFQLAAIRLLIFIGQCRALWKPNQHYLLRASTMMALNANDSTDKSDEKLNVGILLFDDVEVLDFAGPFEVFSRTRTEAGTQSRRTDLTAPFNVFTVASQSTEPISAVGNLKVVADYSFTDAPKVDILLVPGGLGVIALLDHEPTLSWIREVAATSLLTTSVCSGALLLAKAGLLKGKRATTHWSDLDELDKEENIEVDRALRWVEDGDIVSSAGVSAGIDMAFHVVERISGKEVADETGHYMEYPRRLATDPRSSAPQ